MNELKFVRYLEKKFKTEKPVIKGIGDDCAVIPYTKQRYLLLACDMIIENTHFTRNAAAYDIGWKAVAVNISDIAAMGGVPRYALVSIGVKRRYNKRFLAGLVRGIRAITGKFGISVIGGDTNASPETVVNVTLIGEVEKELLVRRDGAVSGDLIFVTGALGEGKVKHLNFTPRLKEARTLVRKFKINAMIDLSDGFAMDLNRLAQASKVGACIYKSLIPLSEKSCREKEAIYAGEDFELLFTASLRESKRIISRMGSKGDLPVSLVGEVCGRSFGVRLIEENGRPVVLKPKGFSHL